MIFDFAKDRDAARIACFVKNASVCHLFNMLETLKLVQNEDLLVQFIEANKYSSLTHNLIIREEITQVKHRFDSARLNTASFDITGRTVRNPGAPLLDVQMNGIAEAENNLNKAKMISIMISFNPVSGNNDHGTVLAITLARKFQRWQVVKIPVH
jgi:hypothetical protein